MKTQTFKSKEHLKIAFVKANIEIFSYAESLIDSNEFTLEKGHDIEYKILTPKDLGFTKYPTTTEIYTKAQEQGCELCTPSEALSIVLEFEQEKGQWTYFAMQSILGSDGGPRVFYVGRNGDGDRWLRAGWVRPGSTWGLDGRLVFRLASNLALGNSESLSVPLEHWKEINIKLDRIISHLGVK